MKLFSADIMRELDNKTINSYGISSITLMENAATYAAKAAERIALSPKAAVFCGSGGNGGDGYAAARLLKEAGFDVRTFFIGKKERITPDCAEMIRRFEAIGGKNCDFEPLCAEFTDFVMSAGVIIDALFGVGLTRDVSGIYLDAVKLINRAPAPVVAADIPSGISADTGAVLGDAVKADITVTFSASKPGLVSEPGCYYCGNVDICDIGIPRRLLDAAETSTFAFTEADLSIPVRPKNGYKGTFGRVLIIAGSVGYTGAPVLAADAAVRSGAGLVFLGVPDTVYPIAAIKCSSAMPFPLKSIGGKISASAIDELAEHIENADTVLLGPGLGRSDGTIQLTKEVIAMCKVPLILDADGIYAAAQNIDVLDNAHCPVILTPHLGEFRTLGGNTDTDRITASASFAKAHNCSLVFKGHRTVTALPDGRVFINTSGNPGMGKGGSGDVLAGLIASLTAQGFSPENAIAGAVYIHGKAGDIAAEKLGQYYMTPSDIIAAFSEIIR